MNCLHEPCPGRLPLWLLIALACVHSFAAIADSSTHSTVLAESVPPHDLGVAYAVRSVLGFGAGVVSPAVIGRALDLAGGGAGSASMRGVAATRAPA
jgi:MFS family permease